MQSEPDIQFEKHQISQQFFQKCTQLTIIEQPFELFTITEQISSRNLQTQFQLLRALTQTKKHRLKLRVNSILQNKKNRYPQQSIYEHSRVILQNEEGSQGYINANWLPLAENCKLIVTQAPLQHTQQQFEQMITQEGIQCVIMLCNIVQNGKVRCFDYLANKKSSCIETFQEAVEISEVSLGNYNYTHIHYLAWPDRSVPQDMIHLEKVLNEALKYERIVIHCSAGLGRSGVISVLLSLLHQLRETTKISVFGAARRFREHRFGAIQNNQQYAFIYGYLKFIYNQSCD